MGIPNPKISMEALAKNAEDKAFRVFAAFRKGTEEVAGFTFFVYNFSMGMGKYIKMNSLYVYEPYRRRGIAKALFTEIAKVAHSEGVLQIGWTVLEHNQVAREFYAKNGGKACGKTIQGKIRMREFLTNGDIKGHVFDVGDCDFSKGSCTKFESRAPPQQVYIEGSIVCSGSSKSIKAKVVLKKRRRGNNEINSQSHESTNNQISNRILLQADSKEPNTVFLQILPVETWGYPTSIFAGPGFPVLRYISFAVNIVKLYATVTITQHDIAHEDFRDENLFIVDGVIKIGDFGSATGEKSLGNDVESLGKILYTFVYGEEPDYKIDRNELERSCREKLEKHKSKWAPLILVS
ncbi:acetyltransferase (GNAT) family domain-containing protein [Ditylenchus destructor]|uniref:Acetyltransferase (GNAT) family domain-containing protein n=1 Tax=Ditylenchus destructor TaxID=166010 RepID=A0AAD4NAR1_9BILA|nr:acetyltransferase (GNAT) family domain-containing protein [Ditylenchus destructor]